MSKVVKGIKKGIKKIGKVVKKALPYIAIGVAAYFTAGTALSYFGATKGFAASLPGFGGSGIFTKAATAMGLNGPAAAAAGAGKAATAGAGLGAKAGASAVKGKLAAGAGKAGASAGASAVKGTLTAKEAAKLAAKEAAKEVSQQTASSAMSVADKLLIAKTVTDTASGLFAESPRDPNEYFWGYDRDGEGMDIIQDGEYAVRPPTTPSPNELYKQTTGRDMPGQSSSQSAQQQRQASRYEQQDARNTPAADVQRQSGLSSPRPGEKDEEDFI